MKSSSRFIKIVEVYSDIAGRRKGAGLGIDALMKSCDEMGSKYFKKYPAEVILDENSAYDEKSKFKYAKYIDRVSLVINRVSSRIKDLRKDRLFPIVLSGDHASSAGTMKGLKEAHPNDDIGVVYIDAHADIHSPYTSASGNMHGMPLSIVTGFDNIESQLNNPTIEEQKLWEDLKGINQIIKPKNIVFCGLRDFERAEEELINRHSIKKYSAKDITYLGIKTVVEEIFKKLNNCRYIYVSFDVDSIDPIYIPGTGTPSENGLSYEQALQLNIQLIKNEKVCCWEIAEINPKYDENLKGTKTIFNILEQVTKVLIKNYLKK